MIPFSFGRVERNYVDCMATITFAWGWLTLCRSGDFPASLPLWRAEVKYCLPWTNGLIICVPGTKISFCEDYKSCLGVIRAHVTRSSRPIILLANCTGLYLSRNQFRASFGVHGPKVPQISWPSFTFTVGLKKTTCLRIFAANDCGCGECVAS